MYSCSPAELLQLRSLRFAAIYVTIAINLRLTSNFGSELAVRAQYSPPRRISLYTCAPFFSLCISIGRQEFGGTHKLRLQCFSYDVDLAISQHEFQCQLVKDT